MPKEKDTMHVQGVKFGGGYVSLTVIDHLPVGEYGLGVEIDGEFGHQQTAYIPWEILQAAVKQAEEKGWLKEPELEEG